MGCDPRLSEISVVFVQPLYDQNVGYLARCMKNFCLGRLVIVSPRCPLGLEARKYAVHAAELVENAVILSSFEEVVKSFDLVACSTGVKGSGPLRRYLTPREAARLLLETSGSKALVIGREDIGLTREELARCDVLVTIDANPEYPSLNASHAAAVLFYELFSAAVGQAPYRIERPPREEVEAFFRHLRRLGELLGYDRQRVESSELVLRRMLGENRVDKSDFRTLFGLIRDSLTRLEACYAQEQ